MTAPYPMLKSGLFMETVRCGEVVYGCGLRSKGQNFTKNLRFFVNGNAIIESIYVDNLYGFDGENNRESTRRSFAG
jgi:hypothetical protein